MHDINLKDDFTRLRVYHDESHFMRSLLQCKECGQLYFYEFTEEIDWEEGNDPQYRALIPVDSEEEAEEISALPPAELIQVFPRLHIDWPSSAGAPEARWVTES